jgi:hypothetical protein
MESLPISLEAGLCLRDMIELEMYLERLDEDTPLLVNRRPAYYRQRLPRNPHLNGTVRPSTGKELLRYGFIQQACGNTSVVSKLGESYYQEHLFSTHLTNRQQSGNPDSLRLSIENLVDGEPVPPLPQRACRDAIAV